MNEEQKNHRMFLNHRDWNGNPALHLAVHFRHKDLVTTLLELGADPTARNGGGFTAVQEAICSGDIDLAEQLSNTFGKNASLEYQDRTPKILEQLQKSPDFECELKWEFKSWVPFLSRILPSDTYKIWKRGSYFRIDTTLTGYRSLRCERGHISFLLMGQDSKYPGKFVLLDHIKKVMEVVDPHQDNQPKNLRELLDRPEVHKVNMKTNEVTFTHAKTFWGYDRNETVASFDTKVYDVDGLDMVVVKRKRSKEVPFPPPILPPKYFKEGVKEGKGEGLPYPTEIVKVSHKSYKGQVNMTDIFPYDIKDILPILEVVAPRAKHFARLKEFIELKMPENNFPVRMEIPLFPSVAAAITFLNFKKETPEEQLFQLDPSYTQGKVEFNFDFKKEGEEEKTKE